MATYIVKRLLSAIPTLLMISVLIFFVTHLIPGDPIRTMFEYEQDPVVVAEMRSLYNLDKPLAVQYLLWLAHVARGSLGHSILLRQPVAGLILDRLPRTLLLMVGGVVTSLFLAIPAGILAAARRNTWVDFGVTMLALVLVSIPGFWLGIMMVFVFAVALKWLPAGGFVYDLTSPWVFAKHLILPTLTLAADLAATTTRILRSSMLDVLRQDYIVLAKAKGASLAKVLLVHALRNAAIPAVTVVSLQVSYLMGGAIVIERVFAYPGMGLLLIKSVTYRDYPLIQGTILVFATIFIIVNLLTDILYSLIDPRIRHA